MNYIITSMQFFGSYLLFAFIMASAFGIIFYDFFNYDKISTKITVSITNFLAFSLFGASFAFYMSLGLTRSDFGAFSNPLINNLFQPIIALTTAGVAYFASYGEENKKSPIVVGGVICFILTTMICYKSFELNLHKCQQDNSCFYIAFS